MKKIFWALSLVGATAYSSTTSANIQIHNDQVYQAQAINDAELEDAISNLAAGRPSLYNTTQIFTESEQNARSNSAKIIINNQSISLPAQNTLPKANSQALSAKAAPSIAAQVASRAAHNKSIGRCAMYVRKALQAAGYQFTSQPSAYMYATNGTLKSAGFVQISSTNYQPQVGDVVVFNRTSKNPHGHIQIYDGSQWVSDFRQPKFSPYSQHGGYSVWRDARHLDASSNTGTYLAFTE